MTRTQEPEAADAATPLGPAITAAQERARYQPTGTLHRVTVAVGGAAACLERAAGTATPVEHLIDVTAYTMSWLARLGVTDPAQDLRAEYQRASLLHPGMTLDADRPTDEQRLAALVEELGEVARACTYDADTTRGHAGDLATEVTQAGALAAAWAARLLTNPTHATTTDKPHTQAGTEEES